MSVNEKMTAIANAIRERTNITDKLTLDDMAGNVDTVYYSAHRAGIEHGKDKQYDEFWDAYQDNGNRTDYQYAFARWRMGAFKPKYDIKPKGAIIMMFAYSKLTDIAQHLEDMGVTLDTSEATGFRDFASYGSVTRLPEISTIGTSSLSGIFYNCPSLITIDKLVFKDDGSQTWESTSFQGLPSLVNIEIEGEIGANFSLSNSSKLSYDSLMSIINALKDYKDTGETRTLTLHKTAKAKLSDSDIAIATQKGWAVA